MCVLHGAGSTWPRTGSEPQVDETNIAWVRAATAAIAPFSVGRYINRAPLAQSCAFCWTALSLHLPCLLQC